MQNFGEETKMKVMRFLPSERPLHRQRDLHNSIENDECIRKQIERSCEQLGVGGAFCLAVIFGLLVPMVTSVFTF